jgi:CheY-like chemotaxis protein
MPVLDGRNIDLFCMKISNSGVGVSATSQIRQIEDARPDSEGAHPTRILALTGMSSLEDKRRAFEAGVDG